MLIVEPACGAGAFHTWTRQGDYLLGQGGIQAADFVVGNPPYIRLEDVPDARMSAYGLPARRWAAGRTSMSASTRLGCAAFVINEKLTGWEGLRQGQGGSRCPKPLGRAVRVGGEPLHQADQLRTPVRVGGSRCGGSLMLE